jgi:hypothetical protein
MRARTRAVLLALALTVPHGLPAQDTTAAGALRVFLDCQGASCDFNFLRTEITWVNWMRDRGDAEVHVLVTGQPTGGGGREYTLEFIGLRDYAGRTDQLRFATPQSATDDVTRRMLARALGQGLVGYAARTALAPRLAVHYDAPRAMPGAAPAQPRDRWNHWVFRAGVNGFFNGESRSRFSNLNGSLRATRVTDDWKLQFRVNAGRNASSFTFDDGSTFSSVSRTGGASALAVRSLGARWSTGLNLAARRSDPENLDLSLRAAPGIEFNVFRYQESTRRQLTLLYELGVRTFDYSDTTIFNRIEETRVDQTVTVALVTRQPWGNTNLSVQGAAFVDDFEQHRVVVGGGLNLRVVKGLDLNVFGSYGRIRDQLYLPKGGATDEQVLLRLRRLQTSYQYFAQIGLSYTFGAIFNNIVNPRFANMEGIFF